MKQTACRFFCKVMEGSVLIYCHHYKLRRGTLRFMGACTLSFLHVHFLTLLKPLSYVKHLSPPAVSTLCQAGYDGVLSIIYSLIYWGSPAPYHVSKVQSKLSLDNFLIFANMKESDYTFVIPLNGPIMKSLFSCLYIWWRTSFKEKA